MERAATVEIFLSRATGKSIATVGNGSGCLLREEGRSDGGHF